MSTKCCCDQEKNHSSSFIFGLIIGAIIGAVIAIIIYRNNKNQVIQKLKKYFEEYFKIFTDNLNKTEAKLIKKTKKVKKLVKPVVAEIKKTVEKVEVKPVTVKTKKPAPKMFVKPKR